MKKELTNEQNLKNLKKREILRILTIIFALATITLAILNLFYGVNIIFALIAYLIVVILTKVRNSTPIILKDDLSDVRKEIANNNLKYGKKNKTDKKKKKK